MISTISNCCCIRLLPVEHHVSCEVNIYPVETEGLVHGDVEDRRAVTVEFPAVDRNHLRLSVAKECQICVAMYVCLC